MNVEVEYRGPWPPWPPVNMVELTVGPTAQSFGGTLESSWLSFGEYDIVALLQMPDNVSVAALSMALGRTGDFKAIKTTPLLTLDEGRRALRRASGAPDVPPSSG